MYVCWVVHPRPKIRRPSTSSRKEFRTVFPSLWGSGVVSCLPSVGPGLRRPEQVRRLDSQCMSDPFLGTIKDSESKV